MIAEMLVALCSINRILSFGANVEGYKYHETASIKPSQVVSDARAPGLENHSSQSQIICE